MSTTVSYKGNTLTTVNNNTKTLETEGKYLEADIILTDVSQSTPTLETVTKSYTPTESQQTETITPSVGNDGIAEVDVTVGAISSSYVGSGITRRDSTDLSATGATVSVPSGYYASNESKAVAAGTEGTPSATKGAVSGNAVTVTPSVTNSAGYISGGTHTGTGVSVSASELVSGTYSVTSAGTKDVTNYASASVPAGSVTAPSTITGSSSSVSTGTNTLTLSKTVSVTPSVTTAGYVTSGTAGNSNVSLTASVTTQGAQTLYPSTTDQTITGSKYLTGTQTFKAVTTSNLTADNIKNGVTVTVGDSADADRILSVTGSYTGGGGTLTVATKTLTNTAVAQTLSFTSLSGQPKYWFLRVTSNVSSSGSTTYYYITDLFYDGTNIKGNCFRIGSTRRVYNITSGITQSYSNGTLTITGGSAVGSQPGQFYGASNIGYELVYIY